MIISDFLFAPGPASIPMFRNASSKGSAREGRAAADTERALCVSVKALLAELAGEAGAEAMRHWVVCSGRGGRAVGLCTIADIVAGRPAW